MAGRGRLRHLACGRRWNPGIARRRPAFRHRLHDAISGMAGRGEAASRKPCRAGGHPFDPHGSACLLRSFQPRAKGQTAVNLAAIGGQRHRHHSRRGYRGRIGRADVAFHRRLRPLARLYRRPPACALPTARTPLAERMGEGNPIAPALAARRTRELLLAEIPGNEDRHSASACPRIRTRRCERPAFRSTARWRGSTIG